MNTLPIHRPILILALSLLLGHFALAAAPSIRLIRTPDGGIQPQSVIDSKGRLHLIYYKGDEAQGGIFYTTSADFGKTFSEPIRVNSQPGAGLAIGSVRGAHLAIGKNGRAHVAWMGSGIATPKAGANSKATPMLYARINDSADAFEPQRNVITSKVGLDGGGSIAADSLGNVYIAWHAPANPKGDEQDRRIWITRSQDEGKTFAPETVAWDENTGACGCCGMRMFADPAGAQYILYRSANEMVNRDIYLLTSPKPGAPFTGQKLADLRIGQCVMSTMSAASADKGALLAYEVKDQVYWTRANPDDAKFSAPVPAPGRPNGRKHPAIAANSAGQVLLVWTEGTGWKKGGNLAWQLFDKSGEPLTDATARGSARGVPIWGIPTAFVDSKGDFVIIY